MVNRSSSRMRVKKSGRMMGEDGHNDGNKSFWWSLIKWVFDFIFALHFFFTYRLHSSARDNSQRFNRVLYQGRKRVTKVSNQMMMFTLLDVDFFSVDDFVRIRVAFSIAFLLCQESLSANPHRRLFLYLSTLFIPPLQSRSCPSFFPIYLIDYCSSYRIMFKLPFHPPLAMACLFSCEK